MPRTMLSDELWQKLKPILLDLNIYDKPNLRNTLEGILFRMRNGCTWRDIPEAFGCHNIVKRLKFETRRQAEDSIQHTARRSRHSIKIKSLYYTIFKTFRRWSKSHKFIRLFHRVIQKPDMEWIFIEGSYVRAQQHSSGACSDSSEGIAKSRGGNTSKFHLAVDAQPNIPKKKNAKTSNQHMDWHIYKTRHWVENAFAKLKHYRAVATRYNKLEQSFTSMIAFACAFIWLKL